MQKNFANFLKFLKFIKCELSNYDLSNAGYVIYFIMHC